ncbi:PAS/PAC sensor hybrid histidine kinase [Gloeothece citriformis PCC 7424]|uniref:Circadian input-output histidine kinase CikA n=1 Tax=Gloeothece citriformis (strain PCC 7424) TaxID=65393 RepID=B7K9A5_GLOC7|nr:PAS domain S-box protein [Gloeothece citriformis]ACK68588.1 PAS/PAC sensor hybrid histidine kinase [Gloeothece citriformis PCC 7424]
MIDFLTGQPNPVQECPYWTILIIDKDIKFHQRIRALLANLNFFSRKFNLVSIYAIENLDKYLNQYSNIALILLSQSWDVAEVINQITEALKTNLFRLILCCENEENLPPISQIINYHITDCLVKDKTTDPELSLTLISALKSYEEVINIANKSQNYRQIKLENIKEKEQKEIKKLRPIKAVLQESEQLFQTMADQAPVMIWISGTDTLCYYFNQVWLDYSGRTLEQEMGNGWAENVHPEDFQYCLDTYLKAFEKRESFQMEYRLRRWDEEYRWLLDHGTPRFSSEGEFLGYIGSCVDISDRKETEKKLQQTRKFLQTVLDYLPIAVFVRDGQKDHFGQYLFWNKTCEHLFGISAEEALGKTRDELFPQEIPDFFRQKDRILFENNNIENIPAEIVESQKLGQRILHTVKLPLYDETHQPKYILGFSEDITDRIKAETERTYLGQLLEASLNEIYVFNAQTLKFQYVNPSALENLGYSWEQMQQMTPLDLKRTFTLTTFKQLILPLKEHQQERLIFETYHYRSDGSVYPVEVHLQLMERPEGNVFLAVILDITERQQAQLALQQAYEQLEIRVQERTAQLEQINQLLRQEVNDRHRIETALCNIALGVTTTNSQIFFQSLVQYMAKALGVEFAIIAKFINEQKKKAKTIAVCIKDEIVDNFEYDLENTPEDDSIQQGLSDYWQQIKQQFPQKDSIQNMDIENYLGVSLLDSEGNAIGLMGVIDTKALDDHKFLTEILQIFAARAVTELERQQAEQNLRESEEKFRQLAENIKEIFYIQDAQTFQTIYVSPTFSEIWGISWDTLYQNPHLWMENIYPPDRAIVRANLQANRNEQEFNYEYRIIRPDGQLRWIWARNFPVKDSSGNIYRIAGIAEDITERKQTQEALKTLNQNLENLVEERTVQLQQIIEQHQQTEEALRKSEERWQLAIYGTNDGLWDWNPQNNELFLSSRWKEMLGYEDHEISSHLREWSSRVHPDDLQEVLRQVMDHLARKTDYYESEYRVRCKDGTYKWTLDRGKAVWDETGKPIRMVGSRRDITDAKQAAEELKRQKEVLQTIFDHIPVMIILFDPTGEIQLVNRALEKTLGWSLEEIQQTDFLVECYPDLQYRQKAINHILYGNGQWQDFKTRVRDGRIIETTWANVELSDETKIGIGQDITIRKRAEAALQETQDRLEFILNNSGAALYTCKATPNLATTFITQGVETMTGYIPEEFIYVPSFWLDHLHPDDQKSILTEVTQLFENGFHTYEYRFQRSDGNYIWVQDRMQVIQDTQGNPIECIGYWFDITHRKRMEEEIRNSEQKLREITSLVPGMVFQFGITSDEKYFFSFASDAVLTIYELTPEQVKEDAQCILALIKPEQLALFQEALEVSRQNLTDFYFEHQITTPSGKEKWVRVSSVPQKLPDQTVIWNGVTIDLTVEKQREAELKQAKEVADLANRAKSEFLANMSHEIRTPMNAILGFCDLLNHLVTDNRGQFYLSAIASAGKTLLALINDILDLSKIEAGKLQLYYEPVNLPTLIQEIYQIFSQKAEEKQIKLLMEIDSSVPTGIIFDEVRLRQILFNVVGNALKFTEEGYVKISLNSYHSETQDQEDSITLKITIEDTGIGIAPEQQTQIFDAFIQSDGQNNRKYGGTGLGLAITKRLTTILGGKIELYSQPNQGSIFSFTFSNVKLIEINLLPQKPVIVNESLEQFLPFDVLIVDDIKSNRNLIQGYFEGSQHKLRFATDGLEAINQVKKYHPNLILLDLRMPRMDGKEVAQYLKSNEKTKDIIIVILTASSLQQEENELKELCDGFLRKPVSRSELVSVLKQLLPLQATLKNPLQNDTLGEHIENISQDSGLEKSEKLSELLALLEGEKNNWEQVCQTMIRRDLKKFAQQLKIWGEDYHYPPLLEYTNLLENYIQSLDVDKLPKTMNAFPEILQALKMIIDS